MRVKFITDIGKNKKGSEADVADWIAKIMIRDGQAIGLDSHKNIDKPNEDKMIRTSKRKEKK